MFELDSTIFPHFQIHFPIKKPLDTHEHMFDNMVMENLRTVDVICQHSADGTIIPMRVRITDEDGLRQAFTIKGYKDLSHHGTRTMPDGVYVTDKTLIFQCKISVIDRERIIMLYYDPTQTVWKMTD